MTQTISVKDSSFYNVYYALTKDVDRRGNRRIWRYRYERLEGGDYKEFVERLRAG